MNCVRNYHDTKIRQCNIRMTEQVLGLISSAHRHLHHWRSNKQPQYAEAETLPLGHRFMLRISDAEWTSHDK